MSIWKKIGIWTTVILAVVGLALVSFMGQGPRGLGPSATAPGLDDFKAAMAAAVQPLQAELAQAKANAEAQAKAQAEVQAKLEAELAEVTRLVTPPTPPAARNPGDKLVIIPTQSQQCWLQSFDGWSDGGDEGVVTAAVAHADGTMADSTVGQITNYDKRGGKLAGASRFMIFGPQIMDGQPADDWTCPDHFILPIRQIVAEQKSDGAQVTIYPREGMVVDLLRAVVEQGRITFYFRKPARAEWEKHEDAVAKSLMANGITATQGRLDQEFQAQERLARLQATLLQSQGQDARLVKLELGGISWMDGRNAANTIQADTVAWTQDLHLRFRDSELGKEFISTQTITLPAAGYFKRVAVVVPVTAATNP
ncbi:MAG: hypothetical protein Q8R28_13395 [Dehalococcoidia bacterium]|nr:hypothetical protein [Dehalococcoidia bacterium]